MQRGVLSHPGLRRALKRVPGLLKLMEARRVARLELNAAVHGVKTGRLAARLKGDAAVMRQSVPEVTPAAPAASPAYLPPEQAAGVLDDLPAGAGVRLLGALDDEAVHRHVLAANLLHRRGLGPRLHDARRLPDATAFVVEHAGDAPADAASADTVLQGVDAILAEDLLAPTAGWRDARHVLGDGTAARYVAFERLTVPAPDRLVRAALEGEARSDLHFGIEYKLRGNRYLYQSVPVVGASGRRNTAARWARMRTMLGDAGVSVQDHLVLDVGCNAGVMLGCALADGAAWGVGYDMPQVAGRATEVLAALGFTRTTVVGGELVPDFDLRAGVPDHVAARLDGCVVLYLAISHHVGFLEQLGDIGWSALLFEGGEEQSMATLEADLAPLRERCAFRIVEGIDYRDGEGRSRPLAVLIREDSPSLASTSSSQERANTHSSAT